MKHSKMIVTDFDGTLFSDDKKINRKDYETLINLGEKGIKRVIATGRSYFSADKVLDKDFPIDYLIFSSGAGILNWKTGEIIRSISIKADEIIKVYKILEESEFDFMLHKEIPENHRFFRFKNNDAENSDFENRCSIYKDYCLEGNSEEIFHLENATQFVVIKNLNKSEDPAEIHSMLKNKLPELKVIRATSPIDRKSLWVEIFPREVSKAKAAQKICSDINISRENVMVIGNDYNDIDMLEWGGKNSFVVANAPADFKKVFKVVSSNNNCGFSEAVGMWLK